MSHAGNIDKVVEDYQLCLVVVQLNVGSSPSCDIFLLA